MTCFQKDLWRVACVLTFLSCASLLPAAEKKTPKKPPAKASVPIAKPLTIQQISAEEARKAGKPILLYLYDPQDAKLTSTIGQQRILNNPGVRQAFAQFTVVLLPKSATNWPAELRAHAKDGPAIVIMTCDAKWVKVVHGLPEAVRGKSGDDEYPALCQAAATALKENPQAQVTANKESQSVGEAVNDILDQDSKDHATARKPGCGPDRKGGVPDPKGGKQGPEEE